MRHLFVMLLWGVLLPAWSQPVLTITYARKANLIAPYGYILEDFSGALTYQHVLQMPPDSFRLLPKVGRFRCWGRQIKPFRRG
jgi:hypothetical protein